MCLLVSQRILDQRVRGKAGWDPRTSFPDLLHPCRSLVVTLEPGILFWSRAMPGPLRTWGCPGAVPRAGWGESGQRRTGAAILAGASARRSGRWAWRLRKAGDLGPVEEQEARPWPDGISPAACLSPVFGEKQVAAGEGGPQGMEAE